MRRSSILVIGVLIYLAIASATTKEIKLLTAPYPPFHGPDLRNQGPITEIVVQAYKKVGYDVSVKFVPWARALKLAKEGKADGLHGAWYSEERKQWFVYSDKLPGSEVVLYKRKGSSPQKFTSFEALHSYKIGIVRGYRNPPAFEAAKLKTAVTDSDKSNLKILAAKRVDLILIDRHTAISLLETDEMSKYRDTLEALEPSVEELSLYLLISKKVADYQVKVDDFNKGLELLREEGGVEGILKDHGL